MLAQFQDRHDAGKRLAEKLWRYRGMSGVVVLALPRGGVPVAHEVAKALGAQLDVFVVRKLGVPGHEELAMGAIATGGVVVLNEDIVHGLDIPYQMVQDVAERESAELARRELAYRGDLGPIALGGKTVIIVDDGLATGATMRAAVMAAKRCSPRAVVVAVPVGAPDVCHAMREVADDVVCARTPIPFRAVGIWYEDFTQTTDEEVRSLLSSKPEPSAAPARTAEVGRVR